LPWSGRSLLLAGMLGVAALLLYLTVSSSLFYPTLAQPLWILAALTLNALPEENPSPGEGQRNWLGLWAPIPVVAMLAAAYFMLVCYPINVASASVRTARQFYALWREENEPAWRQAVKENLPDEKVLVEPKKAEEFIQQNIIRPLGRAAANDSGNAAIWVELAYWRARQWELFADLKISPNTKFVEEASTQLKRYSRAALDALKKAKTADPGGPLAYLHTELLCLRFARMMNPTD